MKTVSEVTAWLNTPGHIKCILADITEVGGSGASSFFLSSLAYFGNSTAYEPCITGGLVFSESLNADGSPSISFGSLEILNTGGINDSFLQYVWNKRPIKIYMGDPSWPKSDFVLIFDGLIQELTAPNENTLSFSLFDKLQKLNDPISEATLSGTNYSENTLDTLLPLVFGECFNIQPLLVDNGSTALTGQVYMAHNGAMNGLIEVRDNGIPITVTENKNAGTFTLLVQPYGTITCSVQGAAGPYTNTVSGIINKLVTSYGTASNRFTTDEISFGDFTNNSPVGLFCSDRQNILMACSELAKSVNSSLICPAIVVDNGVVGGSKLRLIELKAPSGTPKYYLNDDNMLKDSLSISEMFPVRPSIKLSYCKNYTIQTSVAEGLNPLSKFDSEWWYSTTANTTSQTLYRDSGTVSEEETLIITTSAAATEAAKRLSLWQTQRYIVTAKYLPELIFVQLGDIVQITSSRFNLSSGKLGMVYSINRDWTSGLIDIGVLI